MDKWRIDWQYGQVFRKESDGYWFYCKFFQSDFESEASVIAWLESEEEQ